MRYYLFHNGIEQLCFQKCYWKKTRDNIIGKDIQISTERGEDLWYTDRISDNEKHDHRISQWIARKDSPHQIMGIIETITYGKCLVIDDDLQSCEKDEFIYHEALVHPAMILHGNPQKVLILGGGEGATLREVLRYQSVETAIMIDIDNDVIQLCRNHMPSYGAGAFENPRTTLVIADARKYVQETHDTFDVIISISVHRLQAEQLICYIHLSSTRYYAAGFQMVACFVPRLIVAI